MCNKKYYVYIILTESGTYYCGYTDDVQKRYEKHLSGKGAKYTRSHKPIKIVWTQELDTKSEAMRLERKIKNLSHKEKEKLIIGMI